MTGSEISLLTENSRYLQAASLKDFKILSFIPHFLRCHGDHLFQLCAALVNLQFPLIKECTEDTDFD